MATTPTIWAIHGACAATAIFIVYPIGTLKFKLDRYPPWMPHWAVQSTGTALLLLAAGIGLFKSSIIHSGHQIAGIALVIVALLQVFIGQTIQSLAKRVQFQVWAKTHHAIQGFLTLLLGWWTVLSGLQLASHSSSTILTVGLATLAEIIGLIVVCGVARWRYRPVRIPKVVVHDAETQLTPMSQRHDYDEA